VRRFNRAALAAVASVGLFGCGGKSDDQKVRDAVTGLDKALTAHDATKACNYISPALAKQLGGGKSCAAVILAKNPGIDLGSTKSSKVNGSSATVVYQGPSSAPITIQLSKQGGAWKVSGPPNIFK
jgi:hypothetical protein